MNRGSQKALTVRTQAVFPKLRRVKTNVSAQSHRDNDVDFSGRQENNDGCLGHQGSDVAVQHTKALPACQSYGGKRLVRG